MKTTTKIKLKKILGIAMLCFGLNSLASAQCNANFTYNPTGSNGQIYFYNSSTSAPTGTLVTTHFLWTFGDGTTSSVISPSHTFQYTGNYQVNLSVWDSTTNCFDSTSQVVNVDSSATPPPCNLAASFSYSLSSSGLVNFTNTSTSVTAGTIYSWNFGNGASSNQASPSNTFYYNGTYSVTLNISDSSGHCNTIAAQLITISNGNNCNLQAGFTYTLGTNGTITITDASTGISPMTHYTWGFGDGQQYFGIATMHNYAYNGTYYVSLYLGDTLSTCSSSIMDTIIITNAATAPNCAAFFGDSLFANGYALFVDQSTGTTSNTIYLWNFGNGVTSSIQNATYTYSVNGVYGVTLQISDSSTGCSSFHTDSITITNAGTISCMPTVTFMMHQDSLNPQPGVWEISPIYSSQVTGANWYWGDGSSNVGLYPGHTYASAGQYHVCVTVYSACADSSTFCQNDSLYRLANNNSTNGANSMIQVTVVNATTGIKTTTKENAQILVYPNPSAGVINLTVNNVTATKAQINITNILGEVVYTTQEWVNNNSLTKTIDIQNIANGAYFMKVIAGEKSYSNKIIINK